MNETNLPRRLSERDASILDQLAEDGFDPSVVDSLVDEDRARAEAITDLFALLDDYPVDDATDDLVAATLARVNRAEDEQASRMQVGPAPGEGEQLSGRRWRFPDLFATAAMLLLAVGVLWPIANSVNRHRMVALDSDNLSENGSAMVTYTNANAGRTPMEEVASLLPDPFEWLNSHTGTHNTSVRTTLGGHAQDNDFHRPEGDPVGDAYSFQLWRQGDDLMVEGRPIAGNTNPLPGLGTNLAISEAKRPSNAHGDIGQNILFGDRSVRLLKISSIDGDGIWDPGSTSGGLIIEVIRGGERGEDLIFLVH
jgi:hypothetical protein